MKFLLRLILNFYIREYKPNELDVLFDEIARRMNSIEDHYMSGSANTALKQVFRSFNRTILTNPNMVKSQMVNNFDKMIIEPDKFTRLINRLIERNFKKEEITCIDNGFSVRYKNAVIHITASSSILFNTKFLFSILTNGNKYYFSPDQDRTAILWNKLFEIKILGEGFFDD